MPYQSKAEREAASFMTWSEILVHVREAGQCDAKEARRQIGNAREDGVLPVKWADRREDFGLSGPTQMPNDEPPRNSQYWQECETNPDDPDLMLEPPLVDRALVNKRTAARLDKKRRFRKPLFGRDQVFLLWRQTGSSATSATEKQAVSLLTEHLRADNNLRRDRALTICRKQFPGLRLSDRGFRFRIWPRAREAAGLDRNAPRGRRPKQK